MKAVRGNRCMQQSRHMRRVVKWKNFVSLELYFAAA